MIKFFFGVFIIACVFLVGSHLIAHFWPGSSATAFNIPGTQIAINWLLIGTCALCYGTYKMLK